MGFDNECILNIQSLAGEYFCPVCRLLVYPNEALQSQCTHLYCKPCLTYIVATTQACPYDGYLVTEADSKPLAETNKPLAETIGNIAVHCLYHRSGCQWQGSLSACVSHCPTCAFGNSPVVCNRCAVHIVHRQVQDHAQTCSGAPAQPQPSGVSGGDQAQPALAAVPGNDANQQAQALAQASAEQYYQQLLYQQYYQQYYQQQQQPAAVSHLQAPVTNQVTTQQQQQSYPQPQVVPQQPYAQYQQPQVQMQAQLNYLAQPNNVAQNPAAIAVTAHPSEPQMHVGAATQQYYVPPQSQLASMATIQRPQQVLFQQHPVTVPVQQQQHSVQRPYFQQRPVQQTFPWHQVAAPSQLRPVGTPHTRPQFPQNPVGRPSMPGHGVQPQPQPQPHTQFLGGLSRPVYHQDSIPRPPSQSQSGAKLMPAISANIVSGSKPAVVAEVQAENSGSVSKPVDSDNKVTSEVKAEQGSSITAKENEEPIKQEGDVENKLNHSNIGESREVVADEKKDALEEGSEKNKQSATTLVEKKTENGSHEQHEGQGGNLVNDSIPGSENGSQGISRASARIQDGYSEHPHPTLDQGHHQPLAYHHGPTSLPQRPLPPPPPIFDSRAGTMARSTNPNQRPFFIDARQQTFPGSLEHGKLGPNMKGTNNFDHMSPSGSRREFPHLPAERLNSFPAGPNLHMPERVELLHDMRRFPRPGSVSSTFLSRHDVGPFSYSGERRVLRHEDPFARMEPNRSHLDFLERRHFDGLASRSLGREHLGMSLRGFPRPDFDEIHGRELRRLGEPFLGSFSENRFSMLPSHLRRGEFEGLARTGLGDRFRNDVIGHDGFSSHPRGRERIGHHNMYDDFHLRETANFGARSLHARATDIGRSAIELFGGGDRPRYPSLGEPGFRSNLSLHGFPNDGGVTTVKGELDFDRKRKAPTMGWCRICKVDCETIEGLDLHAQTREHQKMAMDVVATIKKNAKKKKLQIGEQSSPRDASKPNNSGNGEDLGKN